MLSQYVSYEYISAILGVLLVLSLFYNYRVTGLLKNRKRGDAALIRNAYFNEVTELPNRNNIEIIINEQIERSQRHNKTFLVVSIEVLNYDVDTILEFSDIVVDTLRNEDIVAHIDERIFVVLFNEYLEEKNFKILYKRLMENINAAKKFKVAVGKSKYPDDGDDASGLIEAAKRHIQN